MKAATTKALKLSRADQKARAVMLDAFDAMPTSGLRHVVAGVAVIHAGLCGDIGCSQEMARSGRRAIAQWARARVSAETKAGAQ